MVFTWLNLTILFFFLVGTIFAVVPIIISKLISPRAKGGSLGTPYECGNRPQGSSWIRFGINYYLYALIFLAFEVDVLYLFPVVVAFGNDPSWIVVLEIVIFIFVLLAAVLYFGRKGVFSWPKKIDISHLQ